MRVDGAPVERMLDAPHRPLVSVFLPDRLDLIKGPPALRRAHLDQFVTAMWPTRAATRRAYAQSLAQRNALIARVRGGGGSLDSLATWDRQLAGHAMKLIADRSAATDQISGMFTRVAAELGIDGISEISYRPRSRAATEDELVAELRERLQSDLERGFTGHGPHRDEISLTRDRRELRTYGSQGQQRLALLALLLAEREALADSRRATPIMLLDDVMSELDRDRREALVELLRSRPGQSLITTTDLDHVPGAALEDLTRLAVVEGGVTEVLAA
jgi:DNA replication and repair protein RecF